MKRKLVLIVLFALLIGSLGVQEKVYASSARIIKVEAGEKHVIALKEDSTVWGWGDNYYGQLGDGTKLNRSYIPVQVSGLSDIISIDTGTYHSVAIKSDGTVWSWGRNNKGQLGDGTLTDRLTPVKVVGLSGIIDIACGYEFTIALKNDGTIWVWGDNSHGQLGIGSTTSKRTPVQVTSISNVSSIKAGHWHVLALKDNGELWTWGYNLFGQCGDGTLTDKSAPIFIMSGVSSINCSSLESSYAMKTDGTVWGWGSNDCGELANGSTNTCVLSPAQIFGISDVKYITGGYFHTLILKNDGAVWVCGSDSYGELGDGVISQINGNEKTALMQLSSISDVVDVTGGKYFTILLLPNGSVWGCGINDSGQLGE